jgi:hypothetical protein
MRTDGMSPMGVSKVLGWQPAGSLEKSTHWPAAADRLVASSDSINAEEPTRVNSRSLGLASIADPPR